MANPTFKPLYGWPSLSYYSTETNQTRFGRRGETREETRDKEPTATMDEATPANGATGAAAAAADAAAEPEVEALEATPFDRAATKKRIEAKLRAGKEARLKSAIK